MLAMLVAALVACCALMPARAIAGPAAGIENVPDGLVIEGTTVTGYTGDAAELTIPEGVTKIGEGAFEWNETLQKVTLPEGLTSIGDNAFSRCSVLKEIVIPNTITEIGASAFLQCKKLTSVNLPEGLTSIGASAFQLCKKLASVDLPQSLTSLGSEAFYDCEALTSITIPAGITEIGSSTFYDCTALSTVTFAEESNVKAIGNGAFRNCESLGSIELPSGVQSIGDYAFAKTESFRSMTLPGVTAIGKNAFDGSGVTEIAMPEVTQIGDKAFRVCSNLKSVSMPKVETIGEEAFLSAALEDLVLPETVRSIGSKAFFVNGGNGIPGQITVPLAVLLKEGIDINAFSGAIDDNPKTEVLITGVDRDITLTASGLEVSGKTIELTKFCATQVETVDGTKKISIVNESGAAITVDGDSVQNGSTKVINDPSDATLSNLSLGAVGLDSDFSSGVEDYAAAVDYSVDEVTVTAVPSGAGASVEVNGTVLSSGAEWATAVPLVEGENAISVVVTSSDTTATKTYTVTITKKAKPADIVIETADDLLAFAGQVKDGVYTDAAGCTVTLAADIDLTGVEWTPIGDDENYFSGTFEGAGHSITGLSVEKTVGSSEFGSMAGLFGYTDGTIRNLTVSGTVSVSAKYVGMIAGYSTGAFKNCVAEGEINSNSSTHTGGVVGCAKGASIGGCISDVSISVDGGRHYVGGIVGYACSSVVEDCENNGKIAPTGASPEAGGIAGASEGSTISHCANRGELDMRGLAGDSPFYVGGIAGDCFGGSTVEFCMNEASIYGNSSQKVAAWIGGIVGSTRVVDVTDEAAINNCLNRGAVAASDSNKGYVGGIVAQMKIGEDGLGDTPLVTNCVSMGQVGFAENGYGPVVGGVDFGSSCEESSFSNNHHLSFIIASVGAPSYGSTSFDEDDITQEFIDKVNEAGGCYYLDENNDIQVCPHTYTLTVDYGYDGKAEVSEHPKGTVVELDAGTRAGYTFAGWTLSGGGFLADASSAKTTLTMTAEDATVTATWKASPYVPPADPTYPPETGETENGEVTITPSRPHEGDEVTIEPVPDEGFEVGGVTVTDKDGNPVEVTDNGDGTWTFVQPDGRVTITVIFRCDGGELCPTRGFLDVDQSQWYHAAADWAVTNHVLNGYGDGGELLGPLNTITRAEMAQVLWNQAGRPEATDDLSSFNDVDASGWYADPVAWCLEQGIFKGYGDTFGTERPISREEVATVLWRLSGSPEPSTGLSSFSDSASVSEYATGALAWAVEYGVVTGKDDGTKLDPQGVCTRAEAAAVLMRMGE